MLKNICVKIFNFTISNKWWYLKIFQQNSSYFSWTRSGSSRRNTYKWSHKIRRLGFLTSKSKTYLFSFSHILFPLLYNFRWWHGVVWWRVRVTDWGIKVLSSHSTQVHYVYLCVLGKGVNPPLLPPSYKRHTAYCSRHCLDDQQSCWVWPQKTFF